jgi:hypothetical protein
MVHVSFSEKINRRRNHWGGLLYSLIAVAFILLSMLYGLCAVASGH